MAYINCLGHISQFCNENSTLISVILLLLDDVKMKMARKPGKKQMENPVGCTREGKRRKGCIREESRKDRSGTVLELSL